MDSGSAVNAFSFVLVALAQAKALQSFLKFERNFHIAMRTEDHPADFLFAPLHIERAALGA